MRPWWLWLVLTLGCSKEWVLPLPEAPADDERAMARAFALADANQERRLHEALAPGSGARLRALRLRDDQPVETWLQEGRALFVTDTPWRPGSVAEVRPLHDRAGATADSTRCVACHFAGGLGGSGGFAERTFLDAERDDVTTARVRAPRMLAGAAVLELLGGAQGRARLGWKGDFTLRDAVARGVSWHLGATATDDEVDALMLAIAAIPLPVEETFERDSLRLRVAAGRTAFERFGCASCHTPALPLTRFTLPLSGSRTLQLEPSVRAQLGVPTGEVPVPLYSDLRPHDVGTGSERDPGPFVTPPLWGVSSRLTLLHDGSVTTFDDAVRAHAGEATKSRLAWEADPEARKQLNLFLLSLTRPTRLEGSP